MTGNKVAGLALAIAGLLMVTAAQAQRMYRCGSTYQDHACDGADGKVVPNFTGPARPAAAVSNDGECRQRGIDAQKIVWARETGALPDKLVADIATEGLKPAKADERRRLILDVYARPRKPSLDTRADIEADCVEAKRLAAEQQLPPGAAALPGDAARAAAPNRVTGIDEAASANKTSQCTWLSRKVADVQASQRAGGGMSVMETLNQRSKELEAERKRLGC